ncbi:hypothetical protein [Agrobacterium vitis]|uniref:hypothetical protein n=1 Tax=Agrobacterium vitis TaxID=373 RepID=UPI001F412A8B|nr:hypothetical protein [Agrobacterium vitis]MCF1452272.1 hypothetical protein [Agrobacterium vitis]
MLGFAKRLWFRFLCAQLGPVIDARIAASILGRQEKQDRTSFSPVAIDASGASPGAVQRIEAALRKVDASIGGRSESLSRDIPKL